MNTKELQISVPWGHIAAKAWGNERDTIVLCFHGILDNAGSFDRLIPLLINGYYFVSIDLPGHGKSSHVPAHMLLYNIDNLLVYKLVMDYFNKTKYIIIGHSFGGQLAFLFTQLYPERVEKLIMLDTVYMLPVSTTHFKDYLTEKIYNYFVLEEKIKNNIQPKYTYEEALEKVQNQRAYGAITEEAARALVERHILQTEDGKYVFTLDQRLKHFMVPLNDIRYIMENIKKNPVLCPVLIVLGNESRAQQMYLRKILDLYRKYRNIKMVNVDGNHDVHNVNPEFVAPHINTFLKHKKNKL